MCLFVPHPRRAVCLLPGEARGAYRCYTRIFVTYFFVPRPRRAVCLLAAAHSAREGPTLGHVRTLVRRGSDMPPEAITPAPLLRSPRGSQGAGRPRVRFFCYALLILRNRCAGPSSGASRQLPPGEARVLLSSAAVSFVTHCLFSVTAARVPPGDVGRGAALQREKGWNTKRTGRRFTPPGPLFWLTHQPSFGFAYHTLLHCSFGRWPVYSWSLAASMTS